MRRSGRRPRQARSSFASDRSRVRGAVQGRRRDPPRVAHAFSIVYPGRDRPVLPKHAVRDAEGDWVSPVVLCVERGVPVPVGATVQESLI